MISTSKTLDPRTAALRAARLARDASRPRPEPRDAHHRVLGLRDPMPFGAYRGRAVEDVMDDNFQYVTWLLENTDVVLSDEAEAEYHARLDPRRPRAVWAK